MNNSKLYSIWIDGEPSPVLSTYPDDGEALRAFRALILSCRDDIEAGILEPDSVSKMVLYCHGYFNIDGCVRGFISPLRMMAADDVAPETDGECEVFE